MNTPLNNSKVACFGEILWDAMPQGLFLGGAPLNVAYHLSRLGQPSMLISSVGRDELGKMAVSRIDRAGIDSTCVHVSETLPTGIADISINENQDAEYDIRIPVAWDEIPSTELTKGKLLDCPAIVFGTLASRSKISCDTLLELLESYQGLKICDINLRIPYDSEDFALGIAKKATTIKLNEEELYKITGLAKDSSSLESALSALKRETNCSMIFVTRGKDSAVYFDGDRMIFARPPENQSIVDTVGAGDAFTAGITQGLLQGIAVESCLQRAVQLGSFVARRQGAQPDYSLEEVFDEG